MTLARRILLTGYGLALASILTWVPWRGGLEVRGGNRDTLGYGLVWSPPQPSADFVEYYERPSLEASPAYITGGPPPDRRSDLVSADQVPPKNSVQTMPQPVHPKKPDGYISPFVYKSATVDYGRVLLEFGALTGVLLGAWMLTTFAPSLTIRK